jgi:hypothetical protein
VLLLDDLVALFLEGLRPTQVACNTATPTPDTHSTGVVDLVWSEQCTGVQLSRLTRPQHPSSQQQLNNPAAFLPTVTPHGRVWCVCVRVLWVEGIQVWEVSCIASTSTLRPRPAVNLSIFDSSFLAFLSCATTW